SHVCTGYLQPAAADNDGEISGTQKLDLFHSRIRNYRNPAILDRRPHLDVDRRLYDGYSARWTVLCSTDAAARCNCNSRRSDFMDSHDADRGLYSRWTVPVCNRLYIRWNTES